MGLLWRLMNILWWSVNRSRPGSGKMAKLNKDRTILEFEVLGPSLGRPSLVDGPTNILEYLGRFAQKEVNHFSKWLKRLGNVRQIVKYLD